MVTVVAVRPGVVEIAEAYSHVADDGIGESDGEGDAEDGVGDGERIEVAITKEEQAGGEAEAEGDEG